MQLVEFDDVVVSLMGLSGWVSVLYYSRGHQVGVRTSKTL